MWTELGLGPYEERSCVSTAYGFQEDLQLGFSFFFFFFSFFRSRRDSSAFLHPSLFASHVLLTVSFASFSNNLLGTEKRKSQKILVYLRSVWGRESYGIGKLSGKHVHHQSAGESTQPMVLIGFQFGQDPNAKIPLILLPVGLGSNLRVKAWF